MFTFLSNVNTISFFILSLTTVSITRLQKNLANITFLVTARHNPTRSNDYYCSHLSLGDKYNNPFYSPFSSITSRLHGSDHVKSANTRSRNFMSTPWH